MKIALIKPPATYADWYKRPVLGLSYISSYLQSEGFDCNIFDAYFNSWSERELLDRVKDYEPEVIGLTAMTHEIIQAAHIGSRIKKHLNVPIVVGGCHITALPEKTLSEFPVFDYGIYGEGEKTFRELLEYLQNDATKNIDSIRGIVFRDGDHVVVNETRPFLTSEELDALPYPAFHNYYGNNRQALIDRNSYYVMFTSRGCPYKCAFCMQVLGRKIRRRSAKNIIQEMEYAIDCYGTHTFDFADEVFLVDSAGTRKVLQLMIEKGFPGRIRWSGLTRANFVKPDLIALAKKAGCYRLEMGVESGDDEILEAIDKRITVRQVRQAVSIIKEVGIPLGTYFIIGHPNETRETIRRTTDLAIELNTEDMAIGIMVPYPGTRIYDMALRGEGGYRLLTQDWSEYDKYGGKALEIKGLPWEELVKWQRRAVVNFYLKNFRLIDFVRNFWQKRSALYFLIKKKITRITRTKKRNN